MADHWIIGLVQATPDGHSKRKTYGFFDLSAVKRRTTSSIGQDAAGSWLGDKRIARASRCTMKRDELPYRSGVAKSLVAYGKCTFIPAKQFERDHEEVIRGERWGSVHTSVSSSLRQRPAAWEDVRGRDTPENGTEIRDPAEGSVLFRATAGESVTTLPMGVCDWLHSVRLLCVNPIPSDSNTTHP